MNTWKTKVHFLIRYHSYFKILLKTTNKHIWKNFKTTQILLLLLFSVHLRFARSRHLRRCWNIDNFALVAYLARVADAECYDLRFLLIFWWRIDSVVIMKGRKTDHVFILLKDVWNQNFPFGRNVCGRQT